MLTIKNLCKKFGSFEAVKNLSLQLGSGDFIGFLGPNGAGKTTTIKIVAGLLSPTSGEVFINGFNNQTDSINSKRFLSYIPDHPFLYDKLTGREFIFFCGGLYGMAGIELKLKVDSVIDELKISSWIDKRTESYSQGMKQRTVIASALIHDPKLLLIDEPMVGLDPQSAKIVKEVFKKKSEEGCSILMSTHSLNVAEEICNRIAIIKDGELIFNDKVEALHEFKEKHYDNLESFFLELTK
ncbi:MAG: ABC transporter [Chlorobiaceae bacterium]|nr:ABC transporter [Chlorobiaceae bacterium]MBA4309575.1 ABC transporter [Chlorobiaceae bacterium]